MSGPELFAVGAAVCLVVASAVALLIYAAILDGRDEVAARRGRPGTHSPRLDALDLQRPVDPVGA